jgi:flagellar hook-basal body complex protein FliE
MTNSITNVNRLVPGLLDKGRPVDETSAEKPSGESFKDHLSSMVNSVNDLQAAAGQAQDAFLSGEPVELHEVMIKAEEAGLAMDLLLEIRNRLVEGYQEIMRMPI